MRGWEQCNSQSVRTCVDVRDICRALQEETHETQPLRQYPGTPGETEKQDSQDS